MLSGGLSKKRRKKSGTTARRSFPRWTKPRLPRKVGTDSLRVVVVRSVRPGYGAFPGRPRAILPGKVTHAAAADSPQGFYRIYGRLYRREVYSNMSEGVKTTDVALPTFAPIVASRLWRCRGRGEIRYK